MATITIELPAMYGDHHVVEVRRILLDLPGVKEVYASSAAHTAEITYNHMEITKKELTAKLDEAGYIGELPIPEETEVPATEGNGTFFRHTQAYTQTGQTVSFAQQIGYEGRPLWPCPGMEPIKGIEE
jgi:copper chaperone CopZ